MLYTNGTELIALSPPSGTVTKRADGGLWIAGNNNPGSFVSLGTNQNNVYFFEIWGQSVGFDCGFDTSITAANRPANYTHYRCVGWGKWQSGAWRLFDMVGTVMRWRGIEAFSTFADGSTSSRLIDGVSGADCLTTLIIHAGAPASGGANCVWFGQTNENAPSVLGYYWDSGAANNKTLSSVLNGLDVRLVRDTIQLIAFSGQIQTRSTIVNTSTVTNSGNWTTPPGYLVQSVDLSPLISI